MNNKLGIWSHLDISFDTHRNLNSDSHNCFYNVFLIIKGIILGHGESKKIVWTLVVTKAPMKNLWVELKNVLLCMKKTAYKLAFMKDLLYLNWIDKKTDDIWRLRERKIYVPFYNAWSHRMILVWWIVLYWARYYFTETVFKHFAPKVWISHCYNGQPGQ